MEKYIGVKIVDAEPMNLGDYNLFRGWAIPEDEDPKRQGSRVVYEDGYVSWSPEEAFKAYRPCESANSVTQKDVDAWIKTIVSVTIGTKTTATTVTMINGFEITETSACVDPANYDKKMGEEICLERIKNKIWFLLGFLMQCVQPMSGESDEYEDSQWPKKETLNPRDVTPRHVTLALNNMTPKTKNCFIQIENESDVKGVAPVVKFTIQSDPIREVGANGCQAQDMLEYVKCLFQSLNSAIPNRETSLTITKLEEALHWQDARTANRERRRVEGTMEK